MGTRWLAQGLPQLLPLASPRGRLQQPFVTLGPSLMRGLGCAEQGSESSGDGGLHTAGGLAGRGHVTPHAPTPRTSRAGPTWVLRFVCSGNFTVALEMSAGKVRTGAQDPSERAPLPAIPSCQLPLAAASSSHLPTSPTPGQVPPDHSCSRPASPRYSGPLGTL